MVHASKEKKGGFLVGLLFLSYLIKTGVFWLGPITSTLNTIMED